MASVQEKIEKGYLRVKTISEIAGRPKEHVEEAIQSYVKRVSSNDEIDVIKQDVADIKELDGDNKGIFSTFVEMDILVKDVPTLFGFCFDYLPSSVEVLEPSNMNISGRYLSHVANDLQAKLHKLDFAIKETRHDNLNLQKNTHLLLRNFVRFLIGKKGRSIEELAKATGMDVEAIQVFLDNPANKKVFHKDGDIYILKNVQ